MKICLSVKINDSQNSTSPSPAELACVQTAPLTILFSSAVRRLFLSTTANIAMVLNLIVVGILPEQRFDDT